MAASTTKTELHEKAGAIEQSEFCSPICERKFCDEVLQLSPDQTEKDIEKELIDEAQSLGLDVSDLLRVLSDASNHRENNAIVHASRCGTADGRTSTAGGSVERPSTAFPNNEFSSSRISNSVRSEISQSTRPTSLGSTESRKHMNSGRSASRLSVSNWPSSPVLDRPGSRDSIRSGFRSAMKGFPNFRKRTSRHNSTSAFSIDSMASLSLSTAVESEVDQKVDEEPQTPASQDAVPQAPGSGAIKRSWESPAVQQNRIGHKLQRDRYVAFERETMEALSTRHKRVMEERRKVYEESEKAMSERNAIEANRVEERHIKAEMDLEEELEREKQSLQICIRHMEGYFKTPSLPPAPGKEKQQSPRKFTQKQRDALHQKYKEQQSIDALHASRIKVLRDRQERKYQEALRKMENHAEELSETNKRHYQDMEKHCEDERISVQLWLESKQKKLQVKWTLEEMILRTRLESQTGDAYGPLPHISFEAGQ